MSLPQAASTAATMRPKREQLDGEVATSITPSRLKRFKPNPAAPKWKTSKDTIEISSAPSLAKKTKTTPCSALKVTTISERTRCFADRRAQTIPTNNPLTKSRLVPCGERKSATLGQKDETMLRLLCNDSKSGEVKELHFRNILHSSINWNNVEHINKINNWRNQIYGRAGMKSKAVTVWLPDEELWFELYYQLSIAESRTRGILLPKTSHILQAFNQTLVGQVLQDSHANNMEPRVERQSNAFASKFNRMCPGLKERLNQCVFGKSGDVFVPKITMEMLRTYKQMKIKMRKMGIEKESAYSKDLEAWQYLFSHLPSNSDVDVQDSSLTSVEDDAAAVLISMASQTVTAHNPIKIEGEQDIHSRSVRLTESENQEDMRVSLAPFTPSTQESSVSTWSTTPELSHTPSLTTSQRFNAPTKSRSVSTVAHSNNESAGMVPEPSRCVSPDCWLDIFTLIASPD